MGNFILMVYHCQTHLKIKSRANCSAFYPTKFLLEFTNYFSNIGRHHVERGVATKVLNDFKVQPFAWPSKDRHQAVDGFRIGFEVFGQFGKGAGQGFPSDGHDQLPDLACRPGASSLEFSNFFV
jgi:hypothetical protein